MCWVWLSHDLHVTCPSPFLSRAMIRSSYISTTSSAASTIPPPSLASFNLASMSSEGQFLPFQEVSTGWEGLWEGLHWETQVGKGISFVQ